MLPAALQARLRSIEEEILRFTQLASQSADTIEQDKYWSWAQDLQREARELRCEIGKIDGASPIPRPTQASSLAPIR